MEEKKTHEIKRGESNEEGSKSARINDGKHARIFLLVLSSQQCHRMKYTNELVAYAPQVDAVFIEFAEGRREPARHITLGPKAALVVV